jgi:hypothetical protein
MGSLGAFMIVRIQASGGSFRGAGKYYLHDKLQGDERIALKDQGDERVWFTDTRNTLNTDPERALDEMWRTAEDQAYLKMQAGVKRGGRVTEDPVKTLSLSWHKDDKPTPEHMIESADAYLKQMGWDAHQAVYVGHNDTEHRHIHIVLNRVNPDTGRTLDDYREQKRSQVWALAYEKEHEQLRCEERELRAAKRDGRAPEIEQHQASPNNDKSAEPHVFDLKPANDHLPHNVIMLTRPLEKQFEADEQTRRLELQSLDSETLKAEQRAEREAFFKDGAKQFKATRHAVYDEVRQEYKPEWQQFYKDADAAEKSADAWSRSSVTRSLYFAKDGKWDEARAAFNDRDSVRDTVAREFADRKIDLKECQTQDLRERQSEACDALRENRDVQYQDLLQRQRDERASLKAGETLEAVGINGGQPNERTTENLRENAANENRTTTVAATVEPQSRTNDPEPVKADAHMHSELLRETAASIGEAVVSQTGAHIDAAPMFAEPEEHGVPAHKIAAQAAGVVGSVASYLADQLGEFFAPTPPEVREAQAKADAKREAEKPVPEEKTNPYSRQIDAALRVVEEERQQREDRTYWEDRDRGKGWERDQ